MLEFYTQRMWEWSHKTEQSVQEWLFKDFSHPLSAGCVWNPRVKIDSIRPPSRDQHTRLELSEKDVCKSSCTLFAAYRR